MGRGPKGAGKVEKVAPWEFLRRRRLVMADMVEEWAAAEPAGFGMEPVVPTGLKGLVVGMVPRVLPGDEAKDAGSGK